MTSDLYGARASRPRGARALFTGRAGGVSAGDFASLNLALHVGDDEVAVRENRARLGRAMGVPVVFVDQVHGAEVHVLEAGVPIAELCDAPRAADALVTARGDVALAIMVADCLPVLLVDAEAGVVGAAHAGRRGLLGGVLQATVRAMAGLGARPGSIAAEIGPSVCGACYEVPAPLRDEAEGILPGIASETSWGTPALDLRAGAVGALAAAGLAPGAVLADAACTVEDHGLFSFRRAARTGRFAGAIRRL